MARRNRELHARNDDDEWPLASYSCTSSASRMHVVNHNWSATKQRPHSQSVAEISRHSVLSGDRILQRHHLGLASYLNILYI